ncbi:MAG: hypothetical protein M3032_03160 [Verrucomicrobiota bacterium]|nr:hypothetical protein [Verrucomicrobiota bacterium]
MSEENEPPAEDDATRERSRARVGGLTPEQRRFLGTPRATDSAKQEAPSRSAKQSPPAESPPRAAREEEAQPAEAPREADRERKQDRRSGGIDLQAHQDAADSHALRNAFVVLSLIIFVAMIFYAGRRFDYVKYLVTSRFHKQALEEGADKFPNASIDELISTGLAAEKRGDWTDAADRFISAKRKNLALPGILYHIGKTSFDRGDLANADAAFAQAIRLKENVPAASYYRGLIALRKHDATTATHYFEEGAAGEPFLGEMFYSWAEALRLDHHPRDAIRRYQQAIERNTNPLDIALCEFKIRLARIEAAEGEKLRAELEAKRAAGPLSVDWLMTDAALKMQIGETAEAAQLINDARAIGATALFLTCGGDFMFTQAAATHEQIRAALGTVAAPAQ